MNDTTKALPTLTTIECSRPHDAYTLMTSGPTLDVHLAAPTEDGGTGPCLCGFDRHARDEKGNSIVGFSVGGGVTGPGIEHNVCGKCANLAGEHPIRGTHARLFGRNDRGY